LWLLGQFCGVRHTNLCPMFYVLHSMLDCK
jgi:hypothetical protein